MRRALVVLRRRSTNSGDGIAHHRSVTNCPRATHDETPPHRLGRRGEDGCATIGPMTSTANAFVIGPGKGEQFRGPVGGPMTIKARAETTEGTFSALENVVPPKEGPPLHRHGHEDEMYYILEGHLRFKLDGTIRDAPAGSFVFIPRGTPHCFQNIGDDPREDPRDVHTGRHGALLRGASGPAAGTDERRHTWRACCGECDGASRTAPGGNRSDLSLWVNGRTATPRA